MDAPFPGFGTVVNIATVVVGALVGMGVGHRIPQRTGRVVTDCLGLATLLMAGLSAATVTDRALADAVGTGAPMLIVLGSLLIGSIVGSLLQLEHRLGRLAGVLETWFARRSPAPAEGTDSGEDAAHVGDEPSARERFIEGWLGASLLFCAGPLTIMGSLSDGMGRGVDQLLLKSVLDGFAAMAFAASFGVGVLLSAVSVAVIQGTLTLAGFVLGTALPEPHVVALTATGGLLLAGISLRLLRIKDIAVADMLPALAVAPLLTQVVILAR